VFVEGVKLNFSFFKFREAFFLREGGSSSIFPKLRHAVFLRERSTFQFFKFRQAFFFGGRSQFFQIFEFRQAFFCWRGPGFKSGQAILLRDWQRGSYKKLLRGSKRWLALVQLVLWWTVIVASPIPYIGCTGWSGPSREQIC
ncbi:unnamed protein product, partial [Laminaria digitata]